MAHVLIAGAGYIGLRLAAVLQAGGHRITGLRRSPPSQANGPAWITADVTRPATLADLPADFDAVVCALAPGGRDAAAYRGIYVTGTGHLMDRLDGRDLPFLFVSSTGIYGENTGAWVDEHTTPAPTTDTGRVLLEAEENVLARRADATVVRFSGIYGPGRTWLVDRVRAGHPVQVEPPTYTNRIHRDDGAGVLAHLLEKRLAGATLPPILLASDDDPAPLADVTGWLAHRLGVPRPPEAPAAADAPRNKRCRNTGLKDTGYRFIHPGYRDGYADMLAKGNPS